MSSTVIERTATSSGDKNPIAHLITTERAYHEVTITPAMARALLRLNTHNRNPRQALVDRYGDDMTHNRWDWNGETCKISRPDANGNVFVIDGQHRFLAAVQYNVSFETALISGLAPEVQDTVDGGGKRTNADVFSLKKCKDPAVLASGLRLLWMWENGYRRLNSRQSPSARTLEALLAENPTFLRSVEIGARVYREFNFVSASSVALAHHLFLKAHPEPVIYIKDGKEQSRSVAHFFAALGSGLGITDEDDPIATLRKRLMRDRDADKAGRAVRYMACLIPAWNAYIEGRTLARIVFDADGKIPEPR